MMKQPSASPKTPRVTPHTPHQEMGAGPKGVAIAPPTYGIDVVDQATTGAVSIGKVEKVEKIEKTDRQSLPAMTGLGLDGAIQQKSDRSAVSKAAGTGQANKTGLPDNLKTGLEILSGMTMDDVTVYYNSAQPAQLQALAYTQGTDIHLGPGQEHYLPHEGWHVVQQKQGRVKPTAQVLGVPVNNEKRLEREAEVMGAKVNAMRPPAQQKTSEIEAYPASESAQNSDPPQVQRKLGKTAPAQLIGFTSIAFNPTVQGQLTVLTDNTHATIQSAEFDMTGSAQITGGTHFEAARWKLGTIQTMYTDFCENIYRETDGTVWKEHYSTGGTIRDGDEKATPWYEKSDIRVFTETNQTLDTGLWDQPETPVAWEAANEAKPGGKGRLFRSRGAIEFAMWMIGLKDGDQKNPFYINYQEWSLDWAVTFNYADNGQKTVRTRSGSTTLGRSGPGKGRRTPSLLKNPTANDKAERLRHTRWSKG